MRENLRKPDVVPEILPWSSRAFHSSQDFTMAILRRPRRSASPASVAITDGGRPRLFRPEDRIELHSSIAPEPSPLEKARTILFKELPPMRRPDNYCLIISRSGPKFLLAVSAYCPLSRLSVWELPPNIAASFYDIGWSESFCCRATLNPGAPTGVGRSGRQ